MFGRYGDFTMVFIRSIISFGIFFWVIAPVMFAMFGKIQKK